jgi:hypothetical protein
VCAFGRQGGTLGQFCWNSLNPTKPLYYIYHHGEYI